MIELKFSQWNIVLLTGEWVLKLLLLEIVQQVLQVKNKPLKNMHFYFFQIGQVFAFKTVNYFKKKKSEY